MVANITMVFRGNIMSIKFKLILISVGIVLAMLISIMAMQFSSSLLNKLSETEISNERLVSGMLMLRRNEKDFLLRYDLKYLKKFDKNYQNMQADVTKLGNLLDGNNISITEYAQLQGIMKKYQLKFHELVAISKQIGLNHKSGLLGSLRASAHNAESFFNMVSNDKLLKFLLMLRRNEKDFLARKNEKYVNNFEKNYQLYLDAINNSPLGSNPKTKLIADLKKYQNDFMQVVALMKKNGLSPKLGIMGEMRKIVHQSEDVFKLTNIAIKEKIDGSIATINTINLIVSILISLLVVSFTLYISQSVTRTLAAFVDTLKTICDTGNLTYRVDDKGKDEIAEVGKTLNKMLSSFQKIVKHLHSSSNDLSNYSSQFMSIRENTFDSVKKQQRETEHVSSSMIEMSASAQNIADNTNQTAEAARQANTISGKGKKIVDQSIQSTQNLESIINNASSVIKQLGEDSNSIGSILDVIRGIAEQTNLLALNAAIEAARAGEQGRGFAVVADEVRMLAQKTQDSISEIEAMIIRLQGGASNAIEAITEGKKGVSENVAKISCAGESLTTIVTELDSIGQKSQENAMATKEQSTVAEEVSKNVVEIKNLGELIVENIEQLKLSSDQMNNLSSEMEDLVKRFQA